MSQSIYSKRVKDVMRRDVVTIPANETLHEALQLMSENRVSALPVVDSRDHCVGVLSTSDLVDVTRDVDDDLDALDRSEEISSSWLTGKLAEKLGHERIDSLMTENVATVQLETPVAQAAREMLRHRVHRLPVVDETGRLRGIVSTMDLLELFADGAPK